jgi:hypothetical protein
MRNLLEQVAQPRNDNITAITYIYGLVDPRTDTVRYIGKSDNPQRRHSNHMCPPETNADTKKSRWINKLLRLKLRPSLVILQVVKSSDWRDAEKTWIADYRQKYGRHFLTNTTAGGDGVEKGFKQRPGTGAKISVANMGHQVSEETRRKIGSANFGKKRSTTERHKMSVADAKYWSECSPSEKLRRVAPLRIPWTQETHDKASKSNRQRNKRANKSSQFIGVSWSHKDQRWRSYIFFNRVTVVSGYYDEELDAAHARDKKAIKLAGDAFRLNFPREDYGNDVTSNYQKRQIQKNNKSGFRGVCVNNRPGRVKKWTATGSIDGKNVCLGYFINKVEAAHAYDRWVIQHRDATAYTNFPRSSYD